LVVENLWFNACIESMLPNWSIEVKFAASDWKRTTSIRHIESMAKLKVGDKAPDFAGLTDQGETVRLSDFRGRKVVLYFYPKDDTSGCTAQACSFRDSYPEIEEQNAVVLGVSPDGAKSHQKFKTKYDLPFTLVVDQDHQIADKYGTWGEKTMYGRKYQGVIRSHFVINENSEIMDVQYNVSPKDSAEKALQSLGALA